MGDGTIEIVRQQAADNSLADNLAGVKRLVLAHVAQVGRDEHQLHYALSAEMLSGEYQLHKFFVGIVQAAAQHYLLR